MKIKTVAAFFGVFVGCILVAYIIGALTCANPDITEWDHAARVFVFTVGGIMSAMIAGGLANEVEIRERERERK